MKAFYYEFFHIPKDGKIREKVLMSHVALTAALIIVYLLAISGSAYAFHTSATRVQNTIVGANFELEVKIAGPEGDEIELQQQEDGMMLALLEQPGIYEVLLEPGGSAETGFGTMQLNGEDYVTAQLGVSVEEDGERRDEIRFNIQAYEPVPVAFMSNWGTSSAYVNYAEGDFEAKNYLVGDEYIEVGDPDNMWMYIEEEITEDPEEEDDAAEAEDEDQILEELSEYTEEIEITENSENTEESDYIEE